MRIVHAVSNIANLPVELAQAQRDLGHRSTAVLFPMLFQPTPRAVNLQRLLDGNRLTRKIRRARVLAWIAGGYDVLHFHYSATFLPQQEDLRLFKACGKKIVFHLHGCDIRQPAKVRAHYAVSACAECPIQCMTPVKQRLPATLRQYADATFVSTPDLLEFVPGAVYLPNPVDISRWDRMRHDIAMEPRGGDEIIVAHAPTQRAIKGTAHIEAAVRFLQREGLPVRLQLLEGMPQPDLLQACRTADIIIDQVLIGWFGLFALEMMALGKPVVAYIRENLQDVQPDVPVVSSNPLDLIATLRALVTSPELRQQRGAAGIKYVRQHHDLATINRRVMQAYFDLEAR